MQDRRYDLPAIGPSTVEGAARAGLAGVAIVAGGAIIAEPQHVRQAGRRSECVRRRRKAAAVSTALHKLCRQRGRPHFPGRDCEESGDRLGAALMRALGASVPAAGSVFPASADTEMESEGIRSLFPIDDLAIVGIDAVIAKLPMILRRIRETAAAVIAANPDMLVIIDSPDFTHRVARKVRAAAPHIRIVDYVSPSVWAWRPGRASAMRAYVDHVLALLPFEPAAHERLGGPPCTYVGHPVTRLPRGCAPMPRSSVRRDSVAAGRAGAAGQPRRRDPAHAAGVRRGRCISRQKIGTVRDRAADGAASRRSASREATAGWQVRPRIVVDQEDKWAAFRVARAALAASGTVTLELAVAGVPTVVSYKISLLEEVVGAADGPDADHRARQSRARRKRHARNSPARRDAGKARGGADVEVIEPIRSSANDNLRLSAEFDTAMGIGREAPATVAADVVLRSSIVPPS